MKQRYAVFAMRDGKPIHRQSIITTFNSALLIKGYFWQNGKDYFSDLGYTLAVCSTNSFDEPVLYGNSYEVTKEIPGY